jgi:predicted NUDIX family NTP pyrophosphohydrolase
MAKKSAGVLMWKRAGGHLHVLLVHPGGPFWRNKDLGAWSVPKGEYDDSEDALVAARRELVEELGPSSAAAAASPDKAFIPLGQVKQKGGKIVTAFALQGDFDVTQLASNTFEIEWPPKSGRSQAFAEADRAEWFTLDTARQKILPGQLELLARAEQFLSPR